MDVYKTLHTIGHAIPRPIRAFLKSAANPWLARVKGYRYKCPLCKLSISQFTPLLVANETLRRDLQSNGFNLELLSSFETLNVQQYACPNCGSSDRDRLYFFWLERELKANTQCLKLLDFAPTAPLRRWLKGFRSVDYRTADLFMDDVDDKIDIQQLHSYSDASFDCFICSHVLEHVPDDERALRELHRVLRPGGWGIVMAPILLTLEQTREDLDCDDIGERVRRFAQADHLRLYSKQDFVRRIERAGFSVSQVRPGELVNDSCEFFGITPQSVLYIARK